MALQHIQLDKLHCSLCLDVLKDPATIPCGHSFCLSCIDRRWNEQEVGEDCTCPTCAKTFTPRPALVTSATFAAVVNELTRLRTALPNHYYATDEDVACDVCNGKKLRSVKSCLVCRASFCEFHLQPHYESSVFLKHQLIPPCTNLAQSVCPRHDEVLKMFCQTDQEVICFLCCTDEHKTHKTVSAETERAKKLDELGLIQEKLHQRVEVKEKDIAVLQNEIDAIIESANKVVTDSQQVFQEVPLLLEKITLQLKEHITRQQEAEVNRVKKLQESLEVEISELRHKETELNQLASVQDYSQFFSTCQSIPRFDEPPNMFLKTSGLLKYFANVTAALSETRDKLHDLLREESANILRKVAAVDVLLPKVEPNSREDFLQYWLQMTLDPNTVNFGLSLSAANKKVTVEREKQCYDNHPDRFMDCLQVLSRHGIVDCSYWEVDIRKGGITVAVSYKSVPRMGEESAFGSNNKSWALNCFDKTFYFRHNNARMFISGPPCHKIGVFVDYRAGVLSFYAVGENMTLLHRVETEFTEPLHAGLGLYWARDSAQMV